MAARKTTRRKTGTATTRRRRSTTSTRNKKGSSQIVNFFVPLFFIFCIVFCLGFLLFMGYRTATASSFFDIEKVELVGVENIAKEKIESIVKSHTVKTGVWNTDLDAIKKDVKEFRYAKNVSVSRVLPNSIQVVVDERIPKAIVRLDGKDFWVDEDAIILSRVSGDEKQPPFIMFGWEETDSEKATENNKKRVALYGELLEKWQSYDLAKRVKVVDLTDLREPQAFIENLGRTVQIRLNGDDYTKGLKKGIETVAGLNRCIEYIVTDGIKMRYEPCNS